MIITLIAALDEAGCIGKDGRLPWHLSTDLKRFRSLTWGHHLIMGRNTYESIGRTLPGRTSIVITRKPDFQAPGCLTTTSLEAAIGLAEGQGESEAFVIGGGQIFSRAMPLASRLHLTRVHAQLECDVYFPPLDEQEWIEMNRMAFPADERNDYPTTYSMFERRVFSVP